MTCGMWHVACGMSHVTCGIPLLQPEGGRIRLTNTTRIVQRTRTWSRLKPGPVSVQRNVMYCPSGEGVVAMLTEPLRVYLKALATTQCTTCGQQPGRAGT